MKYTTEEYLKDFKAWSGGRETLDRLIELDKCDEVESYIEECMPNATETDINDLLWFEDELIAELCGYANSEEFYGD